MADESGLELVEYAVMTALIVAALVFLAPFVFIVLTAFMTNEQALSPDLWPHPFRFQNFADVFNEAPLWRYALNSLIYGGLATLFLLASSIPVAYALAKLRWRGREAAFLVVLVAMLLPPQVTVIPVYVMWAKLHLVGSLWPLILPNLLGDAFSIFLLRQFFLTIPDEYLDAARVDGCGEFRILTTVVLRLTKPAIAAVALFSFLFCFNDFFGPLLYTGESPDNWTLSTNRAWSVLDVLRGAGVNKNRGEASGWGDQRPVAPNLPGSRFGPWEPAAWSIQ